MKLGIDLDGVVCDFANKANAYIWERLPEGARPSRPAPVDKWDWFTHYGAAGKRLFKQIMEVEAGLGFFAGLESLPHAVKSLQHLGRVPIVAGVQQHYVTYLTHRPKLAAYDTQWWLDHHRLPGSLILVDEPEDKLDYGCDLYLDDRPETVDTLRRAGREALLFRQPWNTAWWSNLPSVGTWPEFFAFVYETSKRGAA